MTHRVAISNFLSDSSGFGEAARRTLTALSMIEDFEIAPAILTGGAKTISDGGWRVPMNPALKMFMDAELSGSADVHLIHCAAMDFDKFRPPFLTAKRVGYTVCEADRLHPIQIEGCKSVDQVLVPSKHNQAVFARAGITTTVVPYPIVMPPYIDERDIPNRQAIEGVFDTTFCLYAISTMQERKNIYGLVTAFLHAFTWKDDVALLIKVAGVDATQSVQDAALFVGALCTDMQIQNPPKIRLLGGEWTEPMIWGLHARGDCYVSLARGEAFGIPLLDAAATGNHVIAVPYGGHVDFLPPENTDWIDFRMTPVTMRYAHFNGQQTWADADVLQAARVMKRAALRGRGPKALPDLSAFSTLRVAELWREALLA